MCRSAGVLVKISEGMGVKGKRGKVARLLPMFGVFADWATCNPGYVAQFAVPSSGSQVSEDDVELFRKENRVRSATRVALAELSEQVDRLVKELQPQEFTSLSTVRYLAEQVELRGFPPLADEVEVKGYSHYIICLCFLSHPVFFWCLCRGE
jgi:hypothetical protein